MARDDNTDAEMTMPGTRTSLFMRLAVRSRNGSKFSPERNVIWTFGIVSAALSVRSSDVPAKGKSIVRAALAAAFSN